MAVALTSTHSHQLITSPLEPRIAASQRAWERFRPQMEKDVGGKISFCSPIQVERKAGGWHITETMCAWIGFRDTLMPLCDTVKIISPRDLVERKDLHAPGVGYLALERLLDCEPVVTVMKKKIEGVDFEYLFFKVDTPKHLNELLERAGPEYPARFGPGSIR